MTYFLAILIFALIGGSIFTIFYFTSPDVVNRIKKEEELKLRRTSQELEKIFVNVSLKRLKIFSTIVILFGSVIGFILFKIVGLVVGAVIGFMFPLMILNLSKKMRKSKFNKQLVDAVRLLNSGVKVGLSFIQSIEMVAKDMPPPISEEFALVFAECKMGVSLEEALVRMDSRLQLEELKFLITAILVAREVGGDLPSVLHKLTSTLRERFRLKENIKTYTLMGRAQGYLISAIPIVFLVLVLQKNPKHFDIMLSSDIGRIILIGAFLLNVVGIFVIIQMSKIEI